MFAILCVSNVGQGQRRMNASYLLFSHNSEHVRNFRANTLVWQIYFWTKQQQKMHKIENKLLADVVHERIERIECNFVVRWSDLLFVRFSVVVCFFAFFAKSTWQSVHWTSVNAIARERTSKYYTGRACERIRRNEKKKHDYEFRLQSKCQFTSKYFFFHRSHSNAKQVTIFHIWFVESSSTVVAHVLCVSVRSVAVSGLWLVKANASNHTETTRELKKKKLHINH